MRWLIQSEWKFLHQTKAIRRFDGSASASALIFKSPISNRPHSNVDAMTAIHTVHGTSKNKCKCKCDQLFCLRTYYTWLHTWVLQLSSFKALHICMRSEKPSSSSYVLSPLSNNIFSHYYYFFIFSAHLYTHCVMCMQLSQNLQENVVQLCAVRNFN